MAINPTNSGECERAPASANSTTGPITVWMIATASKAPLAFLAVLCSSSACNSRPTVLVANWLPETILGPLGVTVGNALPHDSQNTAPTGLTAPQWGQVVPGSGGVVAMFPFRVKEMK